MPEVGSTTDINHSLAIDNPRTASVPTVLESVKEYPVVVHYIRGKGRGGSGEVLNTVGRQF